MEQYISKDALVAEIERLMNHFKTCQTLNSYEDGLKEGRFIGYEDALYKINTLETLDTLEVKEVEEKAVSNDLEDYAKKESESFAEREYEIDYIDRNALAKGYYWGVKAGAQWQKQQNTLEPKEVDLELNSFDATVCKIGSTYLKEMDRDAIAKALEPYKDGDKVKVIIKAKGE